ncbi:ribose-5-phosphate isomerase A [Candidatus Vidania fulgoroideorum]
MNKKIIIKIISDYLSKIDNKKTKIFSIGSGNMMEYFVKKADLNKLGISKILTSSNSIKRIIIKKNIKIIKFDYTKKIDYYIGYVKNTYSNFFTKGNNGIISKEKVIYNFSKKKILISSKIINEKNLSVPVEVLPNLLFYIIKELKNKKINCTYKKISSSIYLSGDKMNILYAKYNFINLYLFIRIINSITGVLCVGIFLIFNTTLLIINDNKIKIINK